MDLLGIPGVDKDRTGSILAVDRIKSHGVINLTSNGNDL